MLRNGLDPVIHINGDMSSEVEDLGAALNLDRIV